MVINSIEERKKKMEETVLQENGTETAEIQERTFTQAEMDAIISDRLKRDRAKYADYDAMKEKAAKYDEAVEANKTELQKQTEKAEALQAQLDALTKADEIRRIREKVSNATGVPTTLLLGETEESCSEQAQAILAYKNDTKTTYPNVKDGGEVQKIQHKSVEDQFADWFNKSLNN